MPKTDAGTAGQPRIVSAGFRAWWRNRERPPNGAAPTDQAATRDAYFAGVAFAVNEMLRDRDVDGTMALLEDLMQETRDHVPGVNL